MVIKYNKYINLQPNFYYKVISNRLIIIPYSFFTDINRSICQRLDFDKTTDFNGYTIKISAVYFHSMFDRINEANISSAESQPLSEFNGLDAEIINVTLNQLHLQAMVTIHNNRGSIDEKNKAHGIIGELLEEKYDMGANERYRRGFWRLETYPHDITDMCLMTSRKILHEPVTLHGILMTLMMLQPESFVLFTMINFVAILILMRILNLEFGAATLEFLRILIGTSTFKESVSQNHGSRFLFLNTLLISFWVNLYFGTQLTSSFAIEREDPNINTIEDLIESGYEIAAEKAFTEFLSPDVLQHRFKENTTADCLQYMLPQGNVACLNDCYQTDYYVQTYANRSVHVSRPVYNDYVVYIVREDWPLLPTINEIIQNWRESGVTKFLNNKIFYHNQSLFAKKKRDEIQINNDVGFQGKPLTREKLILSFYIYLFGIITGLAAFLAELFGKISFYKTRIKNIERKHRLKRLQ